jgi:hypothetical protein
MLSFAVTNMQSLLWQSSQWLVGTVLPAVVVERTNEARLKLDTVPLQRNALLDEAARLKAEDMARRGYFAHYSPDGVSPWHWFDEVGYVYAHAGENLAVHFTDSKAVVDAWLQSPAHRANIENGNYLEIGVGTAEGRYEGFKTIFVVQLFGTPAAPVQPLTTLPEPLGTMVEESSDSNDVAPSEPLPSLVLGEMTDLSPVPEVLPVEVESSLNDSVPATVEMKELDREEVSTVESYIATSSAYVPIAAEALRIDMNQSGSSASAALVTTPSSLLRYTYLGLGTVISLILLLSVAVAVRYHRPWQIAYGVGLLILMSGLFYLQSYLTAQVVIADTTAYVIE